MLRLSKNKMKSTIITSVATSAIVTLVFLTLIVGSSIALVKRTIIADNTRDIDYEHYCDSIWIINPDYYQDVLVESDKYQQYIQEHDQWWDN